MATAAEKKAQARTQMDQADRLLIKRIAEDRDVAAMETLFSQYQSRLVPFLRRVARDEAIIEEVFNDVMFKVWNKAHQYQGKSMVSSWIFSIGYRACLRLVKQQSKRDKDALSIDDEQAAESVKQVGMTDSDQTLRRDLDRAIRELPTKQRMVVELSYFQGLSIQEIAVVAECPANTVKTRLHHARQKLRGLLEDSFGEVE